MKFSAIQGVDQTNPSFGRVLSVNQPLFHTLQQSWTFDPLQKLINKRKLVQDLPVCRTKQLVMEQLKDLIKTFLPQVIWLGFTNLLRLLSGLLERLLLPLLLCLCLRLLKPGNKKESHSWQMMEIIKNLVDLSVKQLTIH